MQQSSDDLGLRPLTARSVIASTLLGMQPPELPGQLLVRSGELFRIAEGTTRTALSRMVAAGELTADGSRYRLSGRLLERQARQEHSRHPRLRVWRGEWRAAIVTAERRSPGERADLRGRMALQRFAALREGVWVRPDNLDAPTDAPGCEWFTMRPEGDARTLAAELWDIGGWAARAERLRARMGDVVDDLEAGDTDALAPAFVISAAVLRHLQADPLLPAALLPRDWPGDALRAEYDRYDAAFKRVWRHWFRAVRAS